MFKTALMNLYLHNIGDIYGEIPITLGDALLSDLDNLPAPDELADDIIENLQSALESFQELQTQLKK